MTYINTGSITAIGIIFSVLAIISFAIRASGWRRYPRNLEIDDILIIPAALLTIAAGVAMVIGAQLHILGNHSVPAITRTEQDQLGKLEYAFWMGHVIDVGLIKLALLFLFRRIFKGTAYRTTFDYANWTLIILVSLWTIVFFIFEIFACDRNADASWSTLYSLRHICMDTFAMQTGFAVFCWAMDMAILIEPICMVIPLRMCFREKLQVCLVFCCSIFAVIAGFLRMIVWIQIEVQDTTPQYIKILATILPTVDQEGIVSIILFWTYIEMGVGFQVACLPPCARHLDKLSLRRLMIRLGSFRSWLYRSKRSCDPCRHQARPQKIGSDNDDEIELYRVSVREHV